jgi:hypothetical protein
MASESDWLYQPPFEPSPEYQRGEIYVRSTPVRLRNLPKARPTRRLKRPACIRAEYFEGERPPSCRAALSEAWVEVCPDPRTRGSINWPRLASEIGSDPFFGSDAFFQEIGSDPFFAALPPGLARAIRRRDACRAGRHRRFRRSSRRPERSTQHVRSNRPDRRRHRQWLRRWPGNPAQFLRY